MSNKDWLNFYTEVEEGYRMHTQLAFLCSVPKFKSRYSNEIHYVRIVQHVKWVGMGGMLNGIEGVEVALFVDCERSTRLRFLAAIREHLEWKLARGEA